MARSNEIYGVTIDHDGELLVTFSDHLERINMENLNHVSICKHRRSANRARVDEARRIYVPEYDKGCVTIFALGGNQYELRSANNDMKPVGVALGPRNNIFVSDFDNKCIHRFNVQWIPGNILFLGMYSVRTLNFENTYDGRFGNLVMPMGLAVDSKNRVFVAVDANVEVFDGDNMTSICQHWYHGSPDNSIINPADIAVGVDYYNTSYVYVADWNKNLIHVYQEDRENPNCWALLKIVGCQGSDFGQLNRPMGVDVDQKLNLYVADSKNQRIQIFMCNSLDVYVLKKENGTWKCTKGEWTNTNQTDEITYKPSHFFFAKNTTPYYPIQ
jgi:DNA-binding beta-propeller fold protein YncE